jgi:dTDP-glucose 4,6-dehydratase
MVLASTSETYGDPQVHPQPESYWGHVNPVGPRGVYDEAKRFGEALTTAYRTAHGVDTAIVRIFNTYGPRMRREDGRAIPTFISQALSGQPMTVAGDGSQTRSVCYVDDTVSGILAVAASDLAGPFNVGYPEERTILDIARAVADAVGADVPVEFIGRPIDDPTVRCPDITAIRTQLAWEPQVSFSEGLARTVAWFRATPPADPSGQREQALASDGGPHQSSPAR